MMHSFYTPCHRTSTVSLNEPIACEAAWPQATYSVKPIQPLDTNDPFPANSSIEASLQNGEDAEGSLEDVEVGEDEDAEGEDEESVGLSLLSVRLGPSLTSSRTLKSSLSQKRGINRWEPYSATSG